MKIGFITDEEEEEDDVGAGVDAAFDAALDEAAVDDAAVDDGIDLDEEEMELQYGTGGTLDKEIVIGYEDIDSIEMK